MNEQTNYRGGLDSRLRADGGRSGKEDTLAGYSHRHGTLVPSRL